MELSSSSGTIPMPAKPIVVAYACDVEGNFEYWSRYIEISEVLQRLPSGELELSEDSYFVFGGDVVDRGTGDLRVLTDLVGLRRTYPDRVFFIMGNRDINKMRLPVELHKSSLFVSPRVYWVKPDEDDRDYLQDPSSQVDRLKCMLTKTMGSPLAFEYRRDELKLLNASSSGYGDDDVVESFIDLMRPDGLMMEYLRCANIAVILGDTLFIHGGIQTYNMGWLPPMKVFDMTTVRRFSTGGSNPGSGIVVSNSSSSSSSVASQHRNDSRTSMTSAAAEEGGSGGSDLLSGNPSLSRVFAFGSFDDASETPPPPPPPPPARSSTDLATSKKGIDSVASSSLQDFHAKIYDPMQQLQSQAPSSSTITSSSPPVLPLRAWVTAVNQFALEEVLDFEEHIGAFIEAADKDLSLTDVKKKYESSSSNGDGRCVDICRESISWAAVGGYDHPQPGSRLMQYAMGWMPDKSVNPSVIYAEGLTKATSGYNPNANDPGNKAVPEPSLEVARYLKEGLVNKVIVGHQPRGDAPLILDLGTGVQVISADTSYAANTLWDMHNTGEWSSLPQRRSGVSAIRSVGGHSHSTHNSHNSNSNTPRHSVSVGLNAALGRRSPQLSSQSILMSTTGGGQVIGGGYGSDMGRLPRSRSPAREALAMPPLDFSSLTVSQKQKLVSQMDNRAAAASGIDEDPVIQTARAALEADSPRRASLILASLSDSLEVGTSRRTSDPVMSASTSLRSADDGDISTQNTRRNSTGLTMLASASHRSSRVDVASLTSACSAVVPASVATMPIDTAKKDEKKQKALWSLVKNTLRVTAALRGGVNTGNNTCNNSANNTARSHVESPRPSPPPAKTAGSSNSDPPSSDSAGVSSDSELRQSASFSTTSHQNTATSAVGGSVVLPHSTANSSIASTARSHDGDGMTPRHHQCVEEIVPLMWLRGKPQEENSRGIAVANLLLRMSRASLTLRSTPLAAGDSDRSSRDKIAWSAWAGWDVDLSSSQHKDANATGITTASSSSSSKASTSSEKMNKEQPFAAARKLINKNDCKSDSSIYTGPSPMPPFVTRRAGDDADDENFEASNKIDLVDGTLPPPPQRYTAAAAAAVAAVSSSSLPSSPRGKSSHIAFSSSSKQNSNDSSGRDSSAGGGTSTPSTQANTDVETKSRTDSISTINSKSPSLDAADDAGTSTAKDEVLAMLNSNDLVEDTDFIATDTRHVSKVTSIVGKSAATDSGAAVITAEAPDTVGVTFSATEAERLQMFGQLYKTAASMQRSNAPKTNNKRQRSAFGGSFNVTSSSSLSGILPLQQERSLIGHVTTPTKLLLAERPVDGRILRSLSAGEKDDDDSSRPPFSSVRAKSLRGISGLEESSFFSSSSSSSSMPLGHRKSTAAGNLAAMVDGSIASPLLRQSSALSSDSVSLIRRLDSSGRGNKTTVLLEYPEPAPAVSRLTVYGTLSQGIEYKFELLPPKANPFIGKKTCDGWFVKARGIFLNADEEAEVLAQAKSELLHYRQKHPGTIFPFLSAPGSTTATTDNTTTGITPTRIKRPQGSSGTDGFSVPAEAKARSGSFVLGTSGKDDIAAAAAAIGSLDDVIVDPTEANDLVGAGGGGALSSSASSGGYDEQVPPDSLYLITLTAGFAVKNRVVTEELLRFMMDFSLTDV